MCVGRRPWPVPKSDRCVWARPKPAFEVEPPGPSAGPSNAVRDTSARVLLLPQELSRNGDVEPDRFEDFEYL